MTHEEATKRYPFATKTGIENLFNILLYQGYMCPECGYGTKVTSKNWARCKNCNKRVERKKLDNDTDNI